VYVPAVEVPAAVSSAVEGPPAIPSQVPVEPAKEGPATMSSAAEGPPAIPSPVSVEPAEEGPAAEGPLGVSTAFKGPPVMLPAIERHSAQSAMSPPAEREIPALSPATHAGTTPSSFTDILLTPKIVRKVSVRKSTNKRALVLCQEDVKQAPPEKKGKKQQSRKTRSGSKNKTEPPQKRKSEASSHSR